MMSTLVSLDNVTKHYKIVDDADIVALSDVSLEIRDKEFISLIGPSVNGGAKSVQKAE